jgi:hypothetical protein
MKKAYLGILLLLTSCLVYSLITNTNNQKETNKIIESISKSLDVEKKLAQTRDYYLNLELKYNNIKIDETLKLVDEKGRTFTIKEMLTRKKIVFRYSELQCNVCVENQITSLKKYKDKIGVDNILILADYTNFRNLILFKRLNALDIAVYSLSKKMNIELEEENFPYFFIVDNSLVAKDYFIPIKEIKNYTDNYLNTMYIKHFRNK